MEHETQTDNQVADALDALGRAANRLRRLIPTMSLAQLETIAGISPFSMSAADTLLDLDTWSVVAAAAIRELDGLSALAG